MAALGAATTIGFTVAHVEPVFAGREPVVERLLASTWRDSAAARAPWLRHSADVAVLTPQFEADRRAFALDLMRTGKVGPDRADALAEIAVVEAYQRRVPPALVLGVLLTENTELRSTARSNVGALGLMQVHGKVWKASLGRFFGTDLRDDETNLRYGVYILSHVIGAVHDSLGIEEGWRKALLRYNGCVRGTNTKNCHTYPDVVRKRVERFAQSTCAGRDFERCVARPVWLSRAEQRTTPSSLRVRVQAPASPPEGVPLAFLETHEPTGQIPW